MKKIKIKLSREIKAGLFTIITLAAFIWGFNFLKGRDIFGTQRTFYAVYDNVAGLMTANSITINGLQVGQVKAIYFNPNNSEEVIVELLLSNDVAIPSNSVARLFSSDLLGTRGIQIIAGNASTLAQSGDTLTSVIQQNLKDELNDMVEPIMQKTESLITTFDTVLFAVNDIFNRETRENLISSIESLRNIIVNLEGITHSVDTMVEGQKNRLAAIIANAESITTNLKNNNANLTRIITNTALISDTLAQADVGQVMRQLQQSMARLDDITQRVDRGEGTLGQLLNNDTVYNELENSSRELKELLQDIKLNPGRYVHFSVFGRNPNKKPYQDPKEEDKEE
ncbi:MAG: MlaD family protein [Lentimicrobium sp.]|jgi:phospholipid/cholesterol/gamma-HCH transport system substrate-binding protein|nr:MlaD family protein [Lentimicrobium sp.]